MGTITLYGYHGTTNYYAANIIKENSFHLSTNENEWLGKGIYFWTTEENGIWWADMQFNLLAKRDSLHTSPYVLKCLLQCSKNEYIDLKVDMYKLLDFIQQFENEQTKHGYIQPNFKNIHEKKNYYCTLFKEFYKIKIMIYPFRYTKYNKAGFWEADIEKPQICVSDNKCITILNKKE